MCSASTTEINFLIVLEAASLRSGAIMVRCWWGLFLAHRWLSSCCVRMWPFFCPCISGVERGSLSSVSPYKDTNPTMRAPRSWPHLALIAMQRNLLQIPLHCGLGLLHGNFEGTHSFDKGPKRLGYTPNILNSPLAVFLGFLMYKLVFT